MSATGMKMGGGPAMAYLSQVIEACNEFGAKQSSRRVLTASGEQPGVAPQPQLRAPGPRSA